MLKSNVWSLILRNYELVKIWKLIPNLWQWSKGQLFFNFLNETVTKVQATGFVWFLCVFIFCEFQIEHWSVFFTKGICARNIFKSWKMVPKANPENFVKIWSPEEEIWGFKDVRRCRFYFMDVNHSSSKRATNDSHKEHLHTLTLILMALVRPKVNSNGIKSIFRYFCMILFLH